MQIFSVNFVYNFQASGLLGTTPTSRNVEEGVTDNNITPTPPPRSPHTPINYPVGKPLEVILCFDSFVFIYCGMFI